MSWPSNNSNKSKFGENVLQFNKYFEQEQNFWVVLCVIHATLCFTAVFGNSTILITIWKTSSLHSVANILLASLAVSDLAVGLFVQPLHIVGILSRKRIVFLLFNIMGMFVSVASFINVTVIGIDRLLALQLHLRYRAIVTRARVKMVVIFTWVFSGILASAFSWNQIVFYTAPPVIFICLLLGNFVVYLKIYLIVRRHQRQIQHQQQLQQQENENNIFRVKRFKKTALDTFLVYILLLCCYIPYSSVSKNGSCRRESFDKFLYNNSNISFP